MTSIDINFGDAEKLKNKLRPYRIRARMNTQSDGHSVHFSHYAAKLERHLLNNGISCHDADLIIEESSVLYFERLRVGDGSLFKFLRKKEPSELFVESACKAIKKLLPEAQNSYGSHREIERCIRRS